MDRVDPLGVPIHRMVRRSYARVATHVWTLYPNGLASGDRPRVWRRNASAVRTPLQHCPFTSCGRDPDRAGYDHTYAGAVALGSDSVLGQRPQGRASVHQCQSGDRGGETLVPCRLQDQALPGDCDGGFYEWQVQGRTKQPMWIGLKSHRPFAFASVWEHWHSRMTRASNPVRSCRFSPFWARSHSYLVLEKNCLAKPTRSVLAHFDGYSLPFNPISAHSANRPLSLPTPSPFELY